MDHSVDSADHSAAATEHAHDRRAAALPTGHAPRSSGRRLRAGRTSTTAPVGGDSRHAADAARAHWPRTSTEEHRCARPVAADHRRTTFAAGAAPSGQSGSRSSIHPGRDHWALLSSCERPCTARHFQHTARRRWLARVGARHAGDRAVLHDHDTRVRGGAAPHEHERPATPHTSQASEC